MLGTLMGCLKTMSAPQSLWERATTGSATRRRVFNYLCYQIRTHGRISSDSSSRTPLLLRCARPPSLLLCLAASLTRFTWPAQPRSRSWVSPPSIRVCNTDYDCATLTSGSTSALRLLSYSLIGKHPQRVDTTSSCTIRHDTPRPCSMLPDHDREVPHSRRHDNLRIASE